jgi:hypothetical protein
MNVEGHFTIMHRGVMTTSVSLTGTTLLKLFNYSYRRDSNEELTQL